MDTDNEPLREGNLEEKELTDQIRACVFAVSNELGPGFLEQVDEHALLIELHAAGLGAPAQQPIKVRHKGRVVGDFVADILVEGRVLLELKACRALASEHEAQLLNDLRAIQIKVGLLINFGQSRAQIKRFVL